MTAPARFRQSDVTRAIKAARKAGLFVVAVDPNTGAITTSDQRPQYVFPVVQGDAAGNRKLKRGAL